jgi:hypothetical protein
MVEKADKMCIYLFIRGVREILGCYLLHGIQRTLVSTNVASASMLCCSDKVLDVVDVVSIAWINGQ